MSAAPSRSTIVAVVVFVVLSVVHLVALLAGIEPVSFWTKPFLMPALAFAAIFAGAWHFGTGGRLLIAALLLSTLGDIALLADGNGPFIVGLSAFLLAHVAYILVFSGSTGQGTPSWWSAVFVAWFGFLMAVLVPHLGALMVPVIGYGIVIATMAIVATRCSARVVLGATLFLISDSLLAVDRFVPNGVFVQPDFVIMLTYLAGQAFITWGLVRLWRERQSVGQNTTGERKVVQA